MSNKFRSIAEVSTQPLFVEKKTEQSTREMNKMQVLVGSLETEKVTLQREVVMLRADQEKFKGELQRLMQTNSMLEQDCVKSVRMKRQLENELGDERMKYREMEKRVEEWQKKAVQVSLKDSDSKRLLEEFELLKNRNNQLTLEVERYKKLHMTVSASRIHLNLESRGGTTSFQLIVYA